MRLKVLVTVSFVPGTQKSPNPFPLLLILNKEKKKAIYSVIVSFTFPHLFVLQLQKYEKRDVLKP